MSKTSKQVRKDTVTITLGPKTSALVEAVVSRMNAQHPALVLTTTNIVGSLVMHGLGESLELWELKRPEGWHCVLD